MRFMCSTALVLIGPGLVRALMTYTEFSRIESHNIDRYINILVAGVIAMIDSWRTKRLSPFALVFCFMIMQKILWDMRDSDFIQAIGILITKMF